MYVPPVTDCEGEKIRTLRCTKASSHVPLQTYTAFLSSVFDLAAATSTQDLTTDKNFLSSKRVCVHTYMCCQPNLMSTQLVLSDQLK